MTEPTRAKVLAWAQPDACFPLDLDAVQREIVRLNADLAACRTALAAKLSLSPAINATIDKRWEALPLNTKENGLRRADKVASLFRRTAERGGGG